MICHTWGPALPALIISHNHNKGRKHNLLSFHSESVEAMFETQLFKYQVAMYSLVVLFALANG